MNLYVWGSSNYYTNSNTNEPFNLAILGEDINQIIESINDLMVNGNLDIESKLYYKGLLEHIVTTNPTGVHKVPDHICNMIYTSNPTGICKVPKDIYEMIYGDKPPIPNINKNNMKARKMKRVKYKGSYFYIHFGTSGNGPYTHSMEIYHGSINGTPVYNDSFQSEFPYVANFAGVLKNILDCAIENFWDEQRFYSWDGDLDVLR